ncbi:MAG: ADOP family duplicated permease [Vicinamibacterales bacterium]
MITSVRLAIRQWAERPLVALAAIVSLALGIGANTAIFTVLHGSILQPLPYAEPDRLVGLWETSRDEDHRSLAPANFADWRRLTTAFDGMAAYGNVPGTLSGVGEVQRLRAVAASANLFGVLGVQPIAGRRMAAGDDAAGATPTAMVTEGLARRLFGSPQAAVGTILTVDDVAYTTVGVLGGPLELPNTRDAEIWLSGIDGLPRSEAFPQGLAGVRDSHFIRAVGRLRRGVSIGQAQAQLTAVMDALATEYPATNAGLGARIVPLQEDLVGGVRSLVWILQAAVAVLLLIACANVAHLLLGQAAARRDELATRLALGATEGRIVRQFLAETLVIAVPGGAAGIALAVAGIRALLLAAPAELPRLREVAVDGVVLAFACVVTLGTTLVFGLVPAWQAARDGARVTPGARGVAGSRTVRRWHHGLAVGELALAEVLLVGAALLLVSFANATRVDLGFQTDGRVGAELSLRNDYIRTVAPNGDIDPALKFRFVDRVLDALAGTDGVRATAAGFAAPMSGLPNRGVRIEGDPEPPPDVRPSADFQIVTPDYFRATGMTLVAGRAFTATDTVDRPPVAIVNQAFASRFFAGRDPIGHVVTFGSDRRHEVVGVVADARFESPEAPAEPTFFLPLHQNIERWSALSFVVWSDRPDAAPAALAAAIHAADPLQPIARVGRFSERLSAALAARRFNTWLLGLFAAVALALAAIGAYGVMAYAVASRTREIGVRAALGARPVDLGGLLLRQCLGMASVAAVLGTAGALALTRFMASLLYDVAPRDATTMAGASLVVIAVAVAAAVAPARRAMQVDPIAAMRDGA